MSICIKKYVTGKELIQSLTLALGLPDGVTNLELHADVGSIVTVDLKFELTPEKESGLADVLSGKYQIVKIERGTDA
jgi:hypothetical protein